MPNNERLSHPAPVVNASGTAPISVANAVINTGRSRVSAASIAAVTGSAPATRRSRAKLVTSTLFAEATPIIRSDVKFEAGKDYDVIKDADDLLGPAI